LKYFAQMGSDCWGCICWVAQINKWKVFGCWSLDLEIWHHLKIFYQNNFYSF
jgi:hypothetical protein